jgi:hypothetical protein
MEEDANMKMSTGANKMALKIKRLGCTLGKKQRGWGGCLVVQRCIADRQARIPSQHQINRMEWGLRHAPFYTSLLLRWKCLDRPGGPQL